MLGFSLEVLSPVHIGNGERITNWEYVIEGNRLKVYLYEYLISWFMNTNQAFLQNLRALMQDPNYNLSMLIGRNIKMPEPLYELPLRSSLQTKEVELFIKSLGTPYIPGSELKGAMRTAYMGGLLIKDKSLRKEVERLILQRADSRGKLDEFGSPRGDFEKLFLYPEGKSDGLYDLFKVVSFQDVSFELKDLCVEVPKMVGSRRPLYACEALKEGTHLEGTISIDTRALEKHKSLEGLRYRQDKVDWETLADMCRTFYGLVIELEMEFFKGLNMHQVVKHLQYIRERAEEGILLRIGKHQGYLSTTLMAVFKRENPDLFEKVYERSVPQSRKEKPKTKRLSSKDLTFGWVLIKKI